MRVSDAMRRLNPTTLALIAGVAILLLVVFLFARGGNGDQDKLSDDAIAAKQERRPDERCGSQATYEAIKAELFRQAAETRGSDQRVFDQLARYASLRVENPVLKSRDEGIGTLRCSGRVALDLPPGVAVVGGRRTLAANMDYVLQPAADNSGDVVILEGADPIIVPLATLARSGSNVPLPNLPQPQNGPQPQPVPDAAPQDQAQPVPQVQSPPPAPRVPSSPVSPPSAPRAAPAPEPRPAPGPPTASSSSAQPSFNCRYARTRGEIAVCNDSGLAALDRQMASQYYRGVATGSAGQRELLRRSRTRFLRYRDSCGSDACIADAYRGRMAEIRDIMQNR